MKKLEYSQVVRRKMQALKQRLTRKFDATVSKKNLKRITDAAKGLEVFP